LQGEVIDMKEIKHETFRSDMMSFENDFAGYVIGNYEDHWKTRKCTFFRDGNKMKSWAYCSFERER
jgi:hypothetical protein